MRRRLGARITRPALALTRLSVHARVSGRFHDAGETMTMRARYLSPRYHGSAVRAVTHACRRAAPPTVAVTLTSRQVTRAPHHGGGGGGCASPHHDDGGGGGAARAQERAPSTVLTRTLSLTLFLSLRPEARACVRVITRRYARYARTWMYGRGSI